MTTSGVATWNPEIVDLVEEACSIAGFTPRSGYDFRSARFALNSLFAEWANRGINLWTLTSTSTTLVQGTATYSMPTDAVDAYEVVVRTNAGNTSLQSDLRIDRISASTYSTIPNKLTQGRPIQYLVNRLIAPSITLWPIPDGTTTWVLFYYYLRRVQDAGASADFTTDMPFRAYPAIVAGLAYQMALRKPEVQDRVPFLKSYYEEQWNLFRDEDREKADVRLVPYVGLGGGY